MQPVLCPNCSDPVLDDSGSCQSCGADLRSVVRTRPSDLSGHAPPATPVAFQVGKVFAGRYTIIERIGEGGMGVVYKAHDRTLDCLVALKLIQPDFARLPTYVERFRREVRVTRQITHANICRVHDIGESEGILYLTMEWIEGETLQRLLRQTGTLRAGRALEIAERMARALEAAHGNDVVHRDLKPANVMVDRVGRVVVTDFGLAQEQGAESLTGGRLLGTPAYMAPEQRRAERLDARADLYALGLILREMLTGRPMRPGESIIPEDPSSELHPLISPVLERLLAERREERYSSAREVRQLLKDLLENSAISRSEPADRISRDGNIRRRRPVWVAVSVLVVLVVVVLVVSYAIWSERGEPSLETEALALYEAGDRYLREDSESIRGIDDAIQFFNRALELDEDSALVRARLGEAYWTRYKSEPAPETRQKAEIAVSRAFAIDGSLPEVRNAMAMGLISAGKYAEARAELERALSTRPDYAMAWANLGIVHRELGNYAEGLDAIDKAMHFEPNSYRMHIYRGMFYNEFMEFDKAAGEYRNAIKWKPGSHKAWSNLGAALLYNGEPEQAIEPLEQSLQALDNPFARSNLGMAYYMLERYEDAVAQFRRATELNPHDVVFWTNLGETLVYLGRNEEAREPYGQAATLAREAVLLEPLNPEARADLALYCAYARDVDCAIENALQAAALQESSAEFKRVVAAVYCVLGRDEECLAWLEQAVNFGIGKAQIDTTTEFERLRGDPRFTSIVALAS